MLNYTHVEKKAQQSRRAPQLEDYTMKNKVPAFCKSGAGFKIRMALAAFAKNGTLPTWAKSRKELFTLAQALLA